MNIMEQSQSTESKTSINAVLAKKAEDLTINKSTSPSEANRLSKSGRIFNNHHIPGSIDSWRWKSGVGGNPHRVCMPSERFDGYIKPTAYCQCKESIVDATSFHCTLCGEYFDATENKELVSFRMVNI